ncbi:hypothetical protein BC936DRAFT_138786 [Jimgerdemannia flammicorona]|uniref:Uncharacterized protein n=1 Tax=Jimgerdemannia flammicorona TaxID=994334 RepID=A0A433BJC2_9FUNG|nr:hypothetical protein BC936DRAFT_138786 [Jimgerdemannia flammicorona]
MLFLFGPKLKVVYTSHVLKPAPTHPLPPHRQRGLLQLEFLQGQRRRLHRRRLSHVTLARPLH